MGPPDFRQIIANLMIVRLPPEFAINLLPDYYQVAARYTTRLLPDLTPDSSSILLPDYYQICRQIRHQFFNFYDQDYFI